jgi:hypothetical protein
LAPLISIIIPHYARPVLLVEAVASVRASSVQCFEIIIVDDGSSEEDWSAAQSLADVQTSVLRRTDGPKGPSRCRNLGLAAARGEYVIFLDSDDLVAPWCLDGRIKHALQAPEADLWIFPVLLFRKSPGDMDVLWNVMIDGRDPTERFARSDPPWHTSSPLWRRESLRRLGGFNEDVLYGDDADLHLRALVSGLVPCLFPDELPDAFVRRSDVPRITNSLSEELIESRRVRLREGTRFLTSRPGTHSLLADWEGQYFVEAEFLLFNHAASRAAVFAVLRDWENLFAPPVTRRAVVRAYFAVALACRQRIYLILRIARRLAMRVLPTAYFPHGGQYHSARAGVEVMQALRERIGVVAQTR